MLNINIFNYKFIKLKEDSGFKKIFFINEQIKANKILLLDEEGKKIGVFSIFDALDLGQKQFKDIIQIGYNPVDNIATAKLMDFGKFMFNVKKQDKEKKKVQKTNLLKEIKFRYSIGDNDLKIKLDKAKEFLQEGNSVRIIVVLKGRENVYKSVMIQKLQKISEDLSDISRNQGIKEERPGLTMILFPKLK